MTSPMSPIATLTSDGYLDPNDGPVISHIDEYENAISFVAHSRSLEDLETHININNKARMRRVITIIAMGICGFPTPRYIYMHAQVHKHTQGISCTPFTDTTGVRCGPLLTQILAQFQNKTSAQPPPPTTPPLNY